MSAIQSISEIKEPLENEEEVVLSDGEGGAMDLMDYIDKRVSSIQQVFYTHGPRVDRSDCQLQISLDDGSVLRFSGGADGQSVVVSFTPWTDVFQEPLTQENREYIEKHGKWTIFTVSGEESMCGLVGSRIAGFSSILDEHGEWRGVRLHIGQAYLSYIVDSDEGFVSWGCYRSRYLMG